jgi:hypothetical protein
VEARARFRRAIGWLRSGQNPRPIAHVLYFWGILEALEGNAARGASLFGAAVGLGSNLRNEMDPGELADLDASIATARATLGNEAFERAWAEGKAMTLAQAVDFALSETSSA